MRSPLFLALLVLAGAAQAAVEWPQFHADARHTGGVSSDFAPPRERWWSQSTGGPIEGSPVVSDGRVFVGSTDGKLYAFDAISGSPLWAYNAASPIRTAPALSGGIVYFVTDAGQLVAVDAVTGAKRLESPEGPGASRTNPTIHEGRLFLGTEQGSLVAYDLQTLKKDWEFRIADEQYAASSTYDTTARQFTGANCQARFAARPIRSSPAVYDRKVFFGSDVNALFVVRESPLGGTQAGKTEGAWSDTGGVLACPKAFPVNQMPAAPRYPTAGDFLRASPTIDTKWNLVIVASYDNNVSAYRLDNGDLVWRKNVSLFGRDSRVVSTPAVVDGRVYFGSFNGHFYAFETYQQSGYQPAVYEVWNFTAGDQIWSSPAVSNNLTAFGADDETVYVLDTRNGAERWRYRIGSDVRSSPAIWTGEVDGQTIQGGVLYVGGSDGILYAFGGQRPLLPDLVVDNIQVPSVLVVGEQVLVNVTVRNFGDAASKATDVKLFIDGQLAVTRPVPALQPAQQVSVTYAWTVPPSNHTLVAAVSPGDNREFDRGNNEEQHDTPIAQQPATTPPTTTPPSTRPPTTPPSGSRRAPGLELVVVLGAAVAVALAARRK